MKTWDEHLAWCKTRALEYAEHGDLGGAVASMLSDIRKHPQGEKHAGIVLGASLMMAGLLNDRSEVEKFINGFR